VPSEGAGHGVLRLIAERSSRRAFEVRDLLERNLVRIVGKKDVPGRPILYGTTKRFLEAFGLPSLAQLPSLRDLEEILEKKEEE
jgi:chromosome segregation and condensation protein ScpB